MASPVHARRQHMSDGREPSISAERLDSTSISSSPARLQSNQRSEKSVLRDAQLRDMSDIEVKGTERGREETEGQQQEEEEGEREEQEEDEHEALRQVMKDLEDTTGFGSYKAYLESFRRDPMYAGRSYFNIIDGCFDDPMHASSGVDIIDVSNEDLSPAGVSLRCENLSASGISEALCHPPPSTRAQIVLWPIDTYTRDIEDFVNVLGVGLQLDPCFFEALRWREHMTKFDHYLRSKNVLCISSIGTSVFVARSFVLAQDQPVPVVLIAGPMHEPVENFYYVPDWDARNAPWNAPVPNKAIYDLVQAAPLYGHYNCDGKPHFANAYIRALFSLLRSGRDFVLSSSDTLSACIIPLLQIEIAICKAELDGLGKELRVVDGTDQNTFGLRTRYRGHYRLTSAGARPHLTHDFSSIHHLLFHYI